MNSDIWCLGTDSITSLKLNSKAKSLLCQLLLNVQYLTVLYQSGQIWPIMSQKVKLIKKKKKHPKLVLKSLFVKKVFHLYSDPKKYKQVVKLVSQLRTWVDLKMFL